MRRSWQRSIIFSEIGVRGNKITFPPYFFFPPPSLHTYSTPQMVSDNNNNKPTATTLAVDKIITEMKRGYKPDGYLSGLDETQTEEVKNLLQERTGIKVLFRTPAVDVQDSYRILLAESDVASYSAQEKQVDNIMDKLKECMKTNPWALFTATLQLALFATLIQRMSGESLFYFFEVANHPTDRRHGKKK